MKMRVEIRLLELWHDNITNKEMATIHKRYAVEFDDADGLAREEYDDCVKTLGGQA